MAQTPLQLGSSGKIKEVTSWANIAGRKSRAGLLEREYLSLPLRKVTPEVFIYSNVFKILTKSCLLNMSHHIFKFQTEKVV